MLTLITFSISHEQEFHSSHYKRIREISALTTAVIVMAVVLLMFLSFPLGEADVERSGYVIVYALLLAGAINGGMFISVVLMLLYAVRELIAVGEDPVRSHLVVTAEADETGRKVV